MPLSQILAVSCMLTLVVMTVFVVTILVVMRFGQEWVSKLVERFMNPDKKKDNAKEREQAAAAQPQVASSQALRQRAQNLDFPAPAGGFAAQAAPQNTYPQQDNFGQQGNLGQQPVRASLRSREQYPSFNPQAQAPSQTQGFQPTMPSLSPSRPFQGGGLAPSQPLYQPNPQQGGFPQQPAAPQYPAPQQGGLQPLRPQAPQIGGFSGTPQQGGFQQQPAAPQYPAPQQGGLQPLRPQAPQQGFPQQPQQGGFPPPPQQQGFQQQGFQQPPAPQQGGLGEYRPQLNNTPRPDLRTQSQRPLRRDSRKNDDDDGILGGLIDGAGDILDGF